MSKDRDPLGLSRILKLSLNAAFGMKTPAHAATVRAQRGCKAETDEDSAATSNPMTSTSKLEVETVCVVFQESVKNLDKQAGNISKRPVCKSGRGRGRKLAEKCSRPGLLLQNGGGGLASNSCESQPGDIHLQSINVSLGVGTTADFSVIAAEKDIAETERVDMVLLTNKDQQRMTLKREDTCELPDLVKCQISAGNIKNTPIKKELNTDVGIKELSSNSTLELSSKASALEELASNSSTLDCLTFSDKTMAAEHLSPSKTSIPETNISTGEKYLHRVEKQATKVASPLAVPWKEKEAPDSACFVRGKRTGQQFRACSRNYYTKNDLWFSGLSERRREARPLKFLKQPGLQDHSGASRDSLKYMRKLSNKQTQDTRFCISGRDTFRTQPFELNKEVRGRGAKQQEGGASKSKQQEGYARNGKQLGYAGNGKQHGYASKCKQEGDTGKCKQEGDAGKSKQEGDNRKGKQEGGFASRCKQGQGDASKDKQEGDVSKGKQHGDDSKCKQQEGDSSKATQQGVASKCKQQEGDSSKANQEIGEDRKAKQQMEDPSRAKQQEGDHGKAKQQEGDASKAEQNEGDLGKVKQQEGDHGKAKQQEGDHGKAKQHGGDVSKAKQHEGDVSKAKQHEGDVSKAKQQEGDYCKAKQHEGDVSKAKQHEGDVSKAKQHEGDACKAKQHEGDVSKAKQHGGDVSKAKQQEGDYCKAKQHEGDVSKAKQHGGDVSKAEQHGGDVSKAKQEGDACKAEQHEGDASKAKLHEGDASKINEQESGKKRSKQFQADERESKHQEGNDSKVSQQNMDYGKASGQETDDSKYKQEINGSKYKHCGENVCQSKQEAKNVKPKQQEVAAIKFKQQQCNSKLQVTNNSKCKIQVRSNEGDQRGGDEGKAKQQEGDDRRANKLKEDHRLCDQQEADNTSSKDKVDIGVSETSQYFTIRDSPGEMENMGSLGLDSRCDQQQNCQLFRESKPLAADTLTNRLCQDTSEMLEKDRRMSVESKEDISFKNLEYFSSENIDNFVTLNAIVVAGELEMQEPVVGTCSEFVGCNSSVHTMINAIYQSYEQETIQHDDKPAEIPGSSLVMQESIDVEQVLEEASAHAQEKSSLGCFISSTEKDVVAISDECAAEEKSEGCTFVQKGEGSLYVYAERREVIKSASEERIGDIVCARREGRDGGLAASEKKEVIVCEESACAAKDTSEGSNYFSEEKEELCVFASGEEGDDVFAYKQKGDDVFAHKQKGDDVFAYKQKGELKISAAKVRADTLRNYQDMLDKNVNYETVTVNQDLGNDFKSAPVIPQEMSLPSYHMSESSSKCSADLSTSTESKHSRLREADLLQNPPKETSANHCTSRPPNKTMYAPKIMVNQARQPYWNAGDASHQYDLYTFSRRSDSYSGSNSPVSTSKEKQNSSSFAPFFNTRDLNLPAETLGSEAALNRMMTFLTSCSSNIQQYMSQYKENQPLDVTVTVSLTHPPLSDYIPRLPHLHACDRATASPPCPLPIFPYPGWVPAHPLCWNWWPWVERYPSNITTPSNGIPSHYACYPSATSPVSAESSDSLPSDAHYLPPSQPSGSSQGAAPSGAPADNLCPQMYSPVFDRPEDLGRARASTMDYPSSRQRYWTPEMVTNHPSVKVEVGDYSRARLQTSADVAEEETWNGGHCTESSGQLTKNVGPLDLHQYDYLLGYPRNETAPLSSRSSEETIKEDPERDTGFKQNSVSSCLSKEWLTNNWTSRMTPPAVSVFKHENVGVFSGTATPAASPRSQSPRRHANIPVMSSSSNHTFRSGGFEPQPHSVHQAARRKSAPYHMTRPWTAHQRPNVLQHDTCSEVLCAQNRRRQSYPAAAAISAASQCNNMGEHRQVQSNTSCVSPSDNAASKKRDRDWAVSFVARSRSYNYKFIDSHCHIDFLYSKLEVPRETSFSKFQEEHAEMFPCNYEGCVAVFCNPNTFNADNPKDHILKNVSMEDGIWLAVGCHPKNATEFTDAHLRGLRHILKHSKVVALGEIGLDYSGTFSQNSDIQKLVFKQQLQLALELKLPLVIHCRDADDDCLEILTQMVPSDHRIHAHCFTRDISVAMRWMVPFQNLFLGLTPVVTYKTAVDAANTAAFIPLDRLLLETDAPFFVPNGVHRSIQYSHPGFALFTAEKVAQLKHISVDEVLKACRENTYKMYGI